MPTDLAPAGERRIAGRYELRSVIGRGGAGTVWRAEDVLLRRMVAVKEVNLPASLSEDERRVLRERVLREARAAAAVRHPVLVTVFDVVEDGAKLATGRVFVNAGEGTPDGFRCDVHGNLWCGWGMTAAENGVVVFAPDATMIGRIALPERCANLCFGGRKRNRLMMAASRSIYAVYVNTEGVAGG